MTTSTNLLDYLGKGTLAARTATPSLNPSTHGIYWATDVSQLSLWDGTIWHENILVGGGSSTSNVTGLVSGGQVVWETGLQFRVSAATYYINGTIYTSIEQTVTLTAADATNDRIDVIYLDTSGLAGKVTGTAAATPSEPNINPATQLQLKFVLVNATATAPAGVSTENVYLENTEWTTSTSGATWATASTNNPYAGTKDIEATSLASAAYVQLQRASSETLDSVSTLNFFIRSKAAWASGRGLTLRFYLNGVAKGSPVTLAQGFFNFDSSVTASYQFVSIPIANFVLPAGTLINQLRITDFGGSIGFYIDNITLTTNGTTVGGGSGSGITQADGDARYAQRANNLSDLASASTARTNLDARQRTPQIQSVASSATVTPTFSNDQVNITAQAAALALANPTGTALDGWGIAIRIKDNGTARAISYGTQYRAIGVTLPTTTVISKTLYLGMVFNNADTKWDVVAVAQEA